MLIVDVPGGGRVSLYGARRICFLQGRGLALRMCFRLQLAMSLQVSLAKTRTGGSPTAGGVRRSVQVTKKGRAALNAVQAECRFESLILKKENENWQRMSVSSVSTIR